MCKQWKERRSVNLGLPDSHWPGRLLQRVSLFTAETNPKQGQPLPLKLSGCFEESKRLDPCTNLQARPIVCTETAITTRSEHRNIPQLDLFYIDACVWSITPIR